MHSGAKRIASWPRLFVILMRSSSQILGKYLSFSVKHITVATIHRKIIYAFDNVSLSRT